MVKGNPGFAGGINKRSEARQLSFRLKAAPLRKTDLRLSGVSAVAEGRKLRDHVSELMRAAKDFSGKPVNPAEAMVYIVATNPDLAGPPKPYEIGLTNGDSDLALAKQLIGKLPIGFLIFVRDTTDEKLPVFGHARPLLVEGADGQRAIELCHFALMKVGNLLKKMLADKEN